MAARMFLNLRTIDSAIRANTSTLQHLTPQCRTLAISITNQFTSRRNASQAVAHEKHNHAKIWTAEKAVSASLLGLIPASMIISHPISNYLLALALTAHVHWGVEAIVVDYVRPKTFGPVIPKVGLGAVYFFSIVTLGGLFYFNYNDVGLVTAIKMLWKL